MLYITGAVEYTRGKMWAKLMKRITPKPGRERSAEALVFAFVFPCLGSYNWLLLETGEGGEGDRLSHVLGEREEQPAPCDTRR